MYMCMCVCMTLHMCWICVDMYACMYVHMYVHAYVCSMPACNVPVRIVSMYACIYSIIKTFPHCYIDLMWGTQQISPSIQI